MENIEDLIRENIAFNHAVSSKGWHSVYCEVCGDGQRTKGPRGGWLFSDQACFYNCFNCGIEGNFDPTRENAFSKNMYDIFKSFNIPLKSVFDIVNKHKLEQGEPVVVKKSKVIIPEIKQIPDYFYSLKDASPNDKRANEAKDFLMDRYSVDYTHYDFYLSKGKTNSKDGKDRYMAKYLYPRIIIPAFFREKMIYWQARIFMGESEKKYISCDIEHGNNVLFGMDNMYLNRDKPLYVTEGFFDSFHLNGVAVIRNKITSGRIEILQKCPRPKVVVPDKNKDGMNLAEQAIKLEWGVSLPKFKETDVCDAIKTHGKLLVLKSIVDNTFFDFEAKLRVKELSNQYQK